MLGVSMHTVADIQKYPDQATHVTKTTYQSRPAAKVLTLKIWKSTHATEIKRKIQLQAMHKQMDD